MKRRVNDDNEEDDDISDEEYEGNSDNDAEEDYETSHEARVRQKKETIKKLKDELKRRKVENVDEYLHKQLEEEALEKTGKSMKMISDQCKMPKSSKIVLRRCKYNVTCCTYSVNGNFIYTGTRTGDIVKWCLKTGEVLAIVKGGRRKSKHPFHKSKVTSIAACDEFVASGDLENVIYVWSAEDLSLKKKLIKHRKRITSLVFRQKTQQLFSADKKGVIFVWDMAVMESIEELLKHTAEITAIDSYIKNNLVSCSGVSETAVCLWKLDDEKAVQFSLPKGHIELSLECISLVNEVYFVAGSFYNTIFLWDSINKKSPIHRVFPAHSLPQNSDLKTGTNVMVTAISALKSTNIFASGSNMSEVKVWHIVTGTNGSLVIQLLFVLPNIVGVVNDLRFSPDGRDLAVAISNEHRTNRYQQLCSKAKSSVSIYSLFE